MGNYSHFQTEGTRMVKGLEHMGFVDEQTPQALESLLASGLLKPGQPTTGIGGYLRSAPEPTVVATFALHQSIAKQQRRKKR